MSKKRKKYPPPEFTHKCAREGCTRDIDVKWKYCSRCSGKNRRPNVDALDRRLPGSFGG